MKFNETLSSESRDVSCRRRDRHGKASSHFRQISQTRPKASSLVPDLYEREPTTTDHYGITYLFGAPRKKNILVNANSNITAADVSYIRGLLLIFCSDQRLSGPKRQDNPGRPLIGWQPTAQGGPRPKTRVSNQMEIILRISFSFKKRYEHATKLAAFSIMTP